VSEKSRRAADMFVCQDRARNWARQWEDRAFLVYQSEMTQARELVQICILNQDGEVQLNTYVKPRQEIVERNFLNGHPTLFAYNAITNAMVADAPTFQEIALELRARLIGRSVLAYDSDAEAERLRLAVEGIRAEPIRAHWDSVKFHCSLFHQDYTDAYADFRRYAPASFASDLTIDGALVTEMRAHEALADARATLTLVRVLAAPAPKKEEAPS